jgi:hypothetical protein
MRCDEGIEKDVCLCCEQKVQNPHGRLTPSEAENQMQLLGMIGYSRQSLLTTHRHRVEYQLPGMIEWLKQSANN